jgi:hypothetical protein
MMETHKIELTAAGADRATMDYRGERIGVSHQPIHDAARWLLDNGRGHPTDRVETWRGDVLCLSSTLEYAARFSVSPETMRRSKWVPFDKAAFASRSPSSQAQK